MFSNAHDFIITGGHFYSGQNCIHRASSHGKYFLNLDNPLWWKVDFNKQIHRIGPGYRSRAAHGMSLNATITRHSVEQWLVSGQVAFEDISISREIYKTSMYRLHSDNGSGRARLIKVYHGPRAKEVI
jgi:hypothetical protein